jgi:dethiobiotin synthetase
MILFNLEFRLAILNFFLSSTFTFVAVVIVEGIGGFYVFCWDAETSFDIY